MPPTFHLITREQRDMVLNLFLSDQQTHGHPALPPDDVPMARAWLPEVLTDSDKLGEHVQVLAELYRCAFRPPTPRHDRFEDETPLPSRPTSFTHCELLAEDRANAVAENGPGVLADEELAGLLLNPFALYDLADLIRSTLAEWWIEPLAEAGEAIRRRHDVVIGVGGGKPSRRAERPSRRRQEPMLMGGAPVTAQGEALVIGFADDSRALKQRIAECLYGDPGKDFTLTLHRRRAGDADTCVVELEIAPAPVKEDLALVVSIKGHERTFRLEVPPSVRLDPEADPPDRAFARAAEPVPAAAFRREGPAEWRDDAWPPHLVLRCRVAVATSGPLVGS